MTRETKSALARRLKIHRSQLDGILSKPGAPAPDRRKTYDLREVAAFVTHHREAGALDTLRAARLREVQLRCTKLERELALAAREVVTVKFVHDLISQLEGDFSRLIYLGVESELPPALDGLPATAVRKTLREWADRLIEGMQEAHSKLPQAPA